MHIGSRCVDVLLLRCLVVTYLFSLVSSLYICIAATPQLLPEHPGSGAAAAATMSTRHAPYTLHSPAVLPLMLQHEQAGVVLPAQ
jgi:hypothetical protein